MTPPEPRQAPPAREMPLGRARASEAEQALQRLSGDVANVLAAARRVRCLALVFGLSNALVTPWLAVDERQFLAGVADSECTTTIESEIAAIADLARHRAATAWPEPGVGLTYFHKALNAYWPQCFPIEDFDQYAKIQGRA